MDNSITYFRRGLPKSPEPRVSRQGAQQGEPITSKEFKVEGRSELKRYQFLSLSKPKSGTNVDSSNAKGTNLSIECNRRVSGSVLISDSVTQKSFPPSANSLRR